MWLACRLRNLEDELGWPGHSIRILVLSFFVCSPVLGGREMILLTHELVDNMPRASTRKLTRMKDRHRYICLHCAWPYPDMNNQIKNWSICKKGIEWGILR